MHGEALTSTRVRIRPHEDASERFYELGYTDGLPIVTPSSARVAAFVEAAQCDPTDVVAILPPRSGIATVEKVAVNAVMAGCKPEYLSLVVAAVRAFADPAFNGRINQATSNPAGVLIIVNGPARQRLHVSSGVNCMGQGARANLTIGRALRLILMNVGGGAVGTVDKACHGFPGKVSFCFAEAEDESPWDALHVERGFRPADSTTTLFAAHGTSNIVLHGRPAAVDMLPELAHGMINPGASNFAQGSFGSPLIVLTPNQAHTLANDGVTKSDLKEYLYEHARVPLDWYPHHARASGNLDDKAIQGRVPVTTRPDNIVVVVAGGPGTHSTFIPTFADSQAVTTKVSETLPS